MRFIWLIIGLLLSGIGLYGGATVGMGLGEAMAVGMGIFFILWSTFYEAFRRNGFLKFIKRLFMFGFIVLIIYSAGIVVFGHMDTATYTEDYVIVLGAGLNGSEPTAALEKRLDKTVEYMNRNRNATAIVSGGQGKGESITEAQAMAFYLINRGIGEDRILLEEKATSTYENFANSKEAVGEGQAAFITNDFHVLRSLQMANLNGIDATHVGADTPITLLPAACARELVAQIAAARYYIQ